MDLTQNKITKLPQVQSPCITKLILDENEIAECSLKGHPSLCVLSLNRNKLTSCEGLVGLHHLEELQLGENETLTTLKGLEDLPKLRKLTLNGCKVDSLADFPNLPALEELNLDGNAIASVDQLEKLGHLKNLKELSMAGTPLAEEKADDLKKEIFIALMDELPHLQKINGEVPEEFPAFLKECKAEKIQRIKDAEEARKEAERLAAEEANKPAEGEEAE